MLSPFIFIIVSRNLGFLVDNLILDSLLEVIVGIPLDDLNLDKLPVCREQYFCFIFFAFLENRILVII